MLIKFLYNCFILTFILILILTLIFILVLILFLIFIFIFIMIMIMIIMIIIIYIMIMETIFMNTENSKTSESLRFKLDLADKLNLKNPKKSMALVNLVFITLGKT